MAIKIYHQRIIIRKKEANFMQTNLVKMVQFIVFAIIQLVFLPLTIIGYIFLVVRSMHYSKKHGLLATATNPLGYRWFLHIFGSREDEAGTKM